MTTVEVRYFASLADRAGRASEALEIGDDARVEDLWTLVLERHPGLGGLRRRPLVACDLEYATWDRRLAGVREVAFLPPVSGG